MKTAGWRIVELCAILTLFVSGAFAQQGSVHGRITDEKHLNLRGAHVRIIDAKDTARALIVESEADGTFMFSQIAPGTYRLEATAIGHRKATKTVTVTGPPFNVGTLILAEQPILLGEIVTEGQVPPAVQNGDTTEYLAHAFKTNRDATAEDLLTKMPGITVNNGTVTSGGENVQRVLVDGKPYFGDDATLALRNLPAEVIDKIQLFDQMSDQAQFTGFDDGQSVRALNIMTRRPRNLEFGKTTAGYGDNGRYEVGGNFNDFHGNQRISILGLSNNINEQNFTQQDLLGALSGSNQIRAPGQGPVRNRAYASGGQRSRGGFAQQGPGGPNPYAVSQQQGINTTHMLGANGSDSLADNLFGQASYFFNRTDNHNQQALSRTYLLGRDSTSLYNQNTDVASRNFNHRINARVVYAADPVNSILVLPQLSFQANNAGNAVNAATQAATVLGSLANTSTLNSGYDLGGHVVLRHKFDLPGRTISLDVGLDNTRKKTDAFLTSSTQAFQGRALVTDTSDQQSNYLSTGRTLTANLIYTEPAGENSLMQISYAPSYMENSAEKSTYDFNPLAHAYSTPDPALSNLYANTYFTQTAGAGYRIRTSELNMMAGVSYQYAALRGNQASLLAPEISRTFSTFLPNALLLYTMPDHRSLRVIYRASTRPPTITQLQQVVDNSNPLLLTTGNPSLNQSYTHSLVARYSETLPGQARSMFIFLAATTTRDYIANATLIPSRDTVVPGAGALSPGMQLSTPVNMNGYWNIRTFFTYGFPFSLISSTLNLNAGVTYTRTPGLVNAFRNIANAWSMSEGFVLGSNISENFDFTLSYLGSYTLSRNTLQSDADANYYSHTAAFKWTWTFWEGIVLRNDVTNILTAGQATGYNQDIFLWNISLAKKLFADQQGEIRVGIADLLGQNKSVSHSTTDIYLEDAINEALTRYVMVNFTYTVR